MFKMRIQAKSKKHIALTILAFVLVVCSACSTLVAKESTGVVIASKAQVRSSTAIAAADLLEVVRGDTLDVLDDYVAPDGERWLQVRARDGAATEGWIEARNVLPQEMLERSQKLAEENRKISTQATGQLRASTNLRLTPDLNDDANILFKLGSGARLDIVSWKRVPKQKIGDQAESDDAPKTGVANRNANRNARKSSEPEVAPEDFDLWYLVRLPRGTSPAPAGWLYGKQVELTVPSDVIFYRTGREFVAWHRIDNLSDETDLASGESDASDAEDVRPGSWVILEKSSSKQSTDTDFDRVYVLGYDREKQEHYTAYRGPDVQGVLPLRIEGAGDNKTFIISVKKDGNVSDLRFKIQRDYKGTIKVVPEKPEK